MKYGRLRDFCVFVFVLLLVLTCFFFYLYKGNIFNQKLKWKRKRLSEEVFTANFLLLFSRGSICSSQKLRSVSKRVAGWVPCKPRLMWLDCVYRLMLLTPLRHHIYVSCIMPPNITDLIQVLMVSVLPISSGAFPDVVVSAYRHVDYINTIEPHVDIHHTPMLCV